ncbi:MAG: hypothetical protein JWP02_491 [Acidimicrobiales bacterium]|nr:hypothetical protein [Acidimicrobiales bacterium]
MMSRADRQPLILVVEDEPEVVRLLGVNLDFGGFEVIEAGDGKAGIDSLLS